MWKKLMGRWNQYKYRFVPWIALNLKDRSVRSISKGSEDKIIPDHEVRDTLLKLFSEFYTGDVNWSDNQSNTKTQLPPSYLEKVTNKEHSFGSDGSLHTLLEQQHAQQSGDKLTAERNLSKMKDVLGFSIIRAKSTLSTGGRGVIVNKGTVPKGTVVAMYPGAIYHSFEPILLQSVSNHFIFRCIDGILIDGSDKGISRFLYKSCSQRDRVGPFFISDMSWLTEHPANPLAVGQYVNNHNKEYPDNVAYQEFDVPTTFPFELRQYIPNVHFSAHLSHETGNVNRLSRTVVLISTRDIQEGEELFSSYFTVVH